MFYALWLRNQTSVASNLPICQFGFQMLINFLDSPLSISYYNIFAEKNNPQGICYHCIASAVDVGEDDENNNGASEVDDCFCNCEEVTETVGVVGREICWCCGC